LPRWGARSKVIALVAVVSPSLKYPSLATEYVFVSGRLVFCDRLNLEWQPCQSVINLFVCRS